MNKLVFRSHRKVINHRFAQQEMWLANHWHFLQSLGKGYLQGVCKMFARVKQRAYNERIKSSQPFAPPLRPNTFL